MRDGVALNDGDGVGDGMNIGVGNGEQYTGEVQAPTFT